MQIMLHSTDTSVNAHIVIIQDDKQVIGRAACIIETLERKAATHTAITDYCYHLSFVITLLVRCDSHTQGSRDTVGGVTTGKGIILTLVGRRERTESAHVSICREGIAATGQNLMTCGLMSDIPDNTIVWRIKDVMQCNRKLDHTKPTCEMTRIIGHLLYYLLPEFITNLRQCFDGQSPEVRRKLYLWQ